MVYPYEGMNFSALEKSGIKFDIVKENYAEPIILSRAKKDLKYVQKHSK